MMPLGSHHEQPGPPPADLVEHDLRRSGIRRDRVQPLWRLVRREKVAGETNDALRLGPITVDAHDVDLLAAGQAEELKGLQCARGLAAAAVGDDDAPSFR